jgi:hypothetical protein
MVNMENQENSQEDDRIAWHPAFFEALQMELDEYGHEEKKEEFTTNSTNNTEYYSLFFIRVHSCLFVVESYLLFVFVSEGLW